MATHKWYHNDFKCGQIETRSCINFILVALLFILLASCNTVKRTNHLSGIKPGKSIKTAELIEQLSSDDFEGRRPGTKGMQKATDYIAQYMQDLEIKPMYNGSYMDTLNVRGVEAYNVVGIINEKSNSDDYILIGAHLDHIGKTVSETDSVYNGANDNASGVTAVMQIAKELVKYDFRKKVIIALFTGEESGKIGSRHLSRRLKSNGVPLSYVINFEMVGTPLLIDSSKVYITGFEKSDFAEVSNRLLGEKFILDGKIATGHDLFRMSDNHPFYVDFGIPSHTLSSFDFKNFKYFHHVKDEFAELDIEHMEYVINKITRLILELLEKDVEIQLNEMEQ